MGPRAQEIAPGLWKRVPQRIKKAMTVAQALEDGTWATCIGPDMEEATLREYLALWSATAVIQLTPGMCNSVRWAWEDSSHFMARLAYAARFWGRERAPYATMAWKSKAPPPMSFLQLVGGPESMLDL